MSTVPYVQPAPAAVDAEHQPTVPRTAGPIGFGLAILAVAGLGALLGLTVAGRVLRGPPLWLAMAVMVLPWLYAALGTFTFGAWVLAPDRRAFPVVLAVLAVVSGSMWGPAWADRGEPAVEGVPLEVMSWNVRRLWGHPDHESSAVGCVARTIERHQPDVVTLLEASRHDVEMLSHQLGMQCVHGTYHLSQSSRIGGLATCVRGDNWVLESGAAQRFVDNEDWHYVFTEVRHGHRVVNVLAVHLSPYGPVRRDQTAKRQSRQTAALLERVARFRDPTVLAGDFNSTRDASLHVTLRQHLTDAWERGAMGFGETVRAYDIVPMRVDYVYLTDQFAVHDTESPPTTCSDHRPVITSLTLREAPKPPARQASMR